MVLIVFLLLSCSKITGYIYIYIKISCLYVDWRHVCVSTDVIIRIEHYAVMKLFVDSRHVCRLTSCLSTHVMFVDWRNYRPGHKQRPGHREYKWRPGHRDTTTTGTPGAQGGYINDDWDTGNVRLVSPSTKLKSNH